MATSEARIKANRLNSLKSKGPTSEAGLRRASQNSLKHGMTGAGIVLADQDADVLESRNGGFQAALSPKTEVGKTLIQQMAIFSIRIERSATQEFASIAERVRHASEDFDEARIDAAEALLDIIGENPRTALRKLRLTPEGVDLLIESWQELRAALTHKSRTIWTAWHREQAENLTGTRLEAAEGSRIGELSKAIWGDISGLDDEEAARLDEADRKVWAQILLVERIDAEIAKLEAHYETLDFERIELDRQGAPARALFDPSKEATLARRYGSEATRGFFKCLKELERVEKEAAQQPEPKPAPKVEPPAEPLGSFRETPSLRREPRPTSPQPAVPKSEEWVPTDKSGGFGRKRVPIGSA